MVKISPDNNTHLSNMSREISGMDLTCKIVSDLLMSDIVKVSSHDDCIPQRTNTAETTRKKIVGILS